MISVALINTCGLVVYVGLVLPRGRITRTASNLGARRPGSLKRLGAKPRPKNHHSVAAALHRMELLLACSLRPGIQSFNRTAKRWDLPSGPRPSISDEDWRCLMLEYAAWRKEPDERRKDRRRRHPLEIASSGEVGSCLRQAQLARAECRMALALTRLVAARNSGTDKSASANAKC